MSRARRFPFVPIVQPRSLGYRLGAGWLIVCDVEDLIEALRSEASAPDLEIIPPPTDADYPGGPS